MATDLRTSINTKTRPSRLTIESVKSRIHDAVQDGEGELKEAATWLLSSKAKLLRPRLVLLAADTVRNSVRPSSVDAVLDFAAASEIIHVASLIHDDVIDEAVERRNSTSVNAQFDNHTAVLAGDYLFATAFQLLAKHSPTNAVAIMTRAIRDMCRGEISQKTDRFNPNLTADRYFKRIEGKTSALLAACCEGGVRLAGGDDVQSIHFHRYGKKLGLAFQITDDILDVEGNPDTMGKPIGRDLAQGVITLPIIRLLAHPRWYAQFAPIISSERIDENAIKSIVKAAKTIGAVESVKTTVQRLVIEATVEIEGFVEPGHGLIKLCRQMVSRNR